MVTDQKSRVLKSLYDAYSILYADTDNTPAALTVAASRIVGRKATGGIAAMTAAEARAILNVDDGADVTANNAPQAHGASVHTDRTRTFLVAAHHYTSGDPTSTGVALDPSSVQKVVYRFGLPKDFVSLSSVKILWTVDASDSSDHNVVFDINAKFGTPPGVYFQHDNNDSDNIIAISAYEMLNQWMFTIDSSAFSSIVQGDVVLLTVERDADHASDTFSNDVVILGLIVEYTADM